MILKIEWTVSQGITRVANSVSQVDGKPVIAPASSVGEVLAKEQWPLPGLLPGRKLSLQPWA